ncbi:MAG: hypothetical protein FRX49_01006 [Trebouxia sp. A1-2]|nr:MAG: hypothetical protein FRX49_01006 [Trebouxia sp. A1-2]
MAYRSHAILVITALLGIGAVYGDLDQTVTQRDTLAVVFSTSLDIIGGSSTRYVQSSTVEDLTIQTEAISSDYSWLTEAYTGFTYTPKLDSYASCGTTGTNCTFAFYAIDPSTETTTEAKACRFSMVVSINPITLPNITSSQLYADFSGAPFSASKAPLALLVLLAVPALFFLAL